MVGPRRSSRQQTPASAGKKEVVAKKKTPAKTKIAKAKPTVPKLSKAQATSGTALVSIEACKQ